MRQLFYEGPSKLAWRDVPEPKLKADHEVIVAPIAATTCDVDQAVILGFSPYEPPFSIGHESVARVVEVGDDVHGLNVGDVVSVPYHRTCGACAPCANRTPLHCEHKNLPDRIPSYGFPQAGEWGGMFSEKFRVPWGGHALVKLPASIDPIAAVSLGDNLSDAWSATVPHLRDRPGGRVLITSFGGYGLYAVQWAIAAGASLVTYVDDNPSRLKLAEDLGATPLAWAADLKTAEKYDVILNARPGTEPLEFCLLSAAPGAFCTNMVIFFETVALPLGRMHYSGVTLLSTYNPTRLHMPEVVKALEAGLINPRAIESEIVDLDDVPERLAIPSHRPIVLFEKT